MAFLLSAINRVFRIQMEYWALVEHRQLRVVNEYAVLVLLSGALS